MADEAKPDLRKGKPRGRGARERFARNWRPRPTRLLPRTPKWWDRPLGAVLIVGGIVGAVAILAASRSRVANLSWHVMCAAIVAVLLVGVGLALLAPRHAGRFVLATLWLAPVCLVWVGVEHWLDWHEFYNDTRGKGRLTTATGAKVRGSIIVVCGLVFLSMWTGLLKEARRKRAGRSRPRA